MKALTTEEIFTLIVSNVDLRDFTEDELVQLYQWIDEIIIEYTIISLAVRGEIKLSRFDEGIPSFKPNLKISNSLMEQIEDIGEICEKKYGELQN